jgi:hypothetical protein
LISKEALASLNLILRLNLTKRVGAVHGGLGRRPLKPVPRRYGLFRYASMHRLPPSSIHFSLTHHAVDLRWQACCNVRAQQKTRKRHDKFEVNEGELSMRQRVCMTMRQRVCEMLPYSSSSAVRCHLALLRTACFQLPNRDDAELCCTACMIYLTGSELFVVCARLSQFYSVFILSSPSFVSNPATAPPNSAGGTGDEAPSAWPRAFGWELAIYNPVVMTARRRRAATPSSSTNGDGTGSQSCTDDDLGVYLRVPSTQRVTMPIGWSRRTELFITAHAREPRKQPPRACHVEARSASPTSQREGGGGRTAQTSLRTSLRTLLRASLQARRARAAPTLGSHARTACTQGATESQRRRSS